MKLFFKTQTSKVTPQTEQTERFASSEAAMESSTSLQDLRSGKKVGEATKFCYIPRQDRASQLDLKRNVSESRSVYYIS